MTDTFHSGEKEIQEKTGQSEIAISNSKLITDTIIKGAIGFIEKQPMAIVSSVDKNENVWISVLIGEHGFFEVPDSNSLSINLDKIHSDKEDVFYKNITDGSPIGTLFIELATRRRFRINGTTSIDENRINIAIQESYPNCPKYIQQRNIEDTDAFQQVAVKKQFGELLSVDLQKWITSADTLFLGSISNERRLDASHRGGKKGFIEVVNETSIKVPDYHGNSMFNTFGNIAQNNKSGVLFIDFENRRTLQLTGKTKLLFDQNSKEDLEKTDGTGRFWTFEVAEWIVTENHHHANWEFMSNSPFNP